MGRQPWRFSVAVLGGYETNINFGDPEVDGFGSAIRGTLGRLWRSPRDVFDFSLTGTGVRYFEERAASRGDGSAILSWGHQLSPTVGFSLGGYGTGGSTTSQAFVNALGQVLPRARAWYYGGSSGLDFKLGRRGSLRLNGTYSRVTFDEPTLVGSQYITGLASLTRQLGAKDDISLSYGYYRLEDQNRRPLDNHSGTLGWGRTLSRHFSMNLSAGAGYNPRVAGAIEEAWYFQGSAGLRGQWRRATLSLQGGQSVTPAYGVGGNQISDSASLTAILPFGRRVQLSMSVGHIWARSRSANLTPYRDGSATAALGIGLSRHAGLELGYNYRRSDSDERAAIDAQRAYFGFTYSLP